MGDENTAEPGAAARGAPPGRRAAFLCGAGYGGGLAFLLAFAAGMPQLPTVVPGPDLWSPWGPWQPPAFAWCVLGGDSASGGCGCRPPSAAPSSAGGLHAPPG